jgi:probable F420-dependent oxidoreductase
MRLQEIARGDSARAMRYGLFGINYAACADLATAIAVAQASEQAGFESLWTGEHVVLPDPQAPPSPAPPQTPFLDPVVSLAALAQHTTKVLLGTGIIILPQRNPLVLAKELVSLDVVSGGRLVFGVGVGYLEPEFRALGIPFENKGARTMDYLRAMQAVWTKEKPEHDGRFSKFSGIDAQPRPVQQPHPPIVFGGHTPPAFRRAVEIAAGWYGFAMDVDAAGHCIEGLKAAAKRVERPASLSRLEVSITPPPGLPDADAVKRYADLGVDRLILLPPPGRRDDLLRYVEAASKSFAMRG